MGLVINMGMRYFLLAFAPVLGGFLVKKLFSMVGLGDVFKLSGALTSGIAGAGKLGGDQNIGSRFSSGFNEKITKQGNKLGKKIGKEELGKSIAEGNILKATKFSTKGIFSPVKSTKKGLKHASDMKEHYKDSKSEKVKIDGLVKKGYKKLKNKNSSSNYDNEIEALMDGSPLAIATATVATTGRGSALDIDKKGENKFQGKKGVVRNSSELRKNSHQNRENIKAASANRDYDGKKKLKNDYYLKQVGDLKRSSPTSNITEGDYDETLNSISSEYNIQKGKVILPTNGMPPIVGISSDPNKKVNIAKDFDSTKELLQNPIHYLPDNFKSRIKGETDNAYSLRLHSALSEMGLYDSSSGQYADMLDKFSISDSDIENLMVGNNSRINTLELDLNSNIRSETKSFSKEYDLIERSEIEARIESTKKLALAHLKSQLDILDMPLSSLSNSELNSYHSSETLSKINSLPKSQQEKEISRLIESFEDDINKEVKKVLDKKSAELQVISYSLANKINTAGEEEKKDIIEQINKLEDEYQNYNSQMENSVKEAIASLNSNYIENVEIVTGSITRLLSNQINEVNSSNNITKQIADVKVVRNDDAFNFKSNTSEKMKSKVSPSKIFKNLAGNFNG